LPTFDDPDSAFPEQRRALLAVGDDFATADSRCDRSAHANAYNKRRAIIECRQDPRSCGEVCYGSIAYAIGADGSAVGSANDPTHAPRRIDPFSCLCGRRASGQDGLHRWCDERDERFWVHVTDRRDLHQLPADDQADEHR